MMAENGAGDTSRGKCKPEFKHARISMRLTGGEKDRLQGIANAGHTTVSEIVLSGFHASEQRKKDLLYLFEFFQENASNLEITDEKRKHIKEIYESVKQ